MKLESAKRLYVRVVEDEAVGRDDGQIFEARCGDDEAVCGITPTPSAFSSVGLMNCLAWLGAKWRS